MSNFFLINTKLESTASQILLHYFECKEQVGALPCCDPLGDNIACYHLSQRLRVPPLYTQQGS